MNKLKDLFGSKKKYDTGLVLSGGGVRGFAHAGILKALEEQDIKPDIISGVSAGAIVGALYADGHTPDEMMEIFSEGKSFFEYAKISIPKKGLFKTVGLQNNLEKYLKSEEIEDLEIPLFIAATNLAGGEIEYFSSGELIPRVLASASIPVVFEPVEIDGTSFVDGGVMDNFPISPIIKKCKRLIGISLNTIQAVDDPNNLFGIAERSFHLSVSSNLKPKTDQCDVIFEIDELEEYGYLDVSKSDDLFELGYQKAREMIKSGILR